MADDKAVVLTGASDDLIEVDGAFEEEFPLQDSRDGDLVAFSDGTVLRIVYTRDGVWRITPVVRGTAELTIEQAPQDEDDYSDRATLRGDIAWAVHGIAIVKR